jgi:hypothetical protein
MREKSLLITAFMMILVLLLNSCNLPTTHAPTEAIQPSGGSEAPAASPVIPGGSAISIVSVAPPVPAGISIADPVTVLVHYNLGIPEGTLQIWFERFSDANCTILKYSSDGGTTMAGTLEPAVSGEHEAAITFPPLPLIEVDYVGVGVRLWTPDNSTVLVEDMRYDACYAVHTPPANLVIANVGDVSPGVTPGGPTPGGGSSPGAPSAFGAINGVVYMDANGNGVMDAGEFGAGPYMIQLADVGCATLLTTTTTDANGAYAFFNMPPGNFCVILTYSSGIVLPGYSQRHAVLANSTTRVFFGIQPAASAPPPHSTGYCGDGTLDTAAGEQCDPPNLTNCTASCQAYTGYCGNGIIDDSLGEQCDPPNITNCTASCQIYIPFCGDGYVDAAVGEQCDPPNLTDCTASCQSYTPFCGDGYVDAAAGEQCDPPNTTNCTASCQSYTPVCGDGYVDTAAGEQCDPPNTTNCTASCQSYTPVCGDGYVDATAGEQCDPPNVDFCTASCQLYLPYCGNSVLDLGEECDPPNTTDCTAQCQIWP